jgi:hypothetical protein
MVSQRKQLAGWNEGELMLPTSAVLLVASCMLLSKAPAISCQGLAHPWFNCYECSDLHG